MLPLTVADHIRETILDYLKTTFRLSDKAVEAALLEFLQDDEQGMFKGPYLDLRLPFQKAKEQTDQTKGGLTIGPPFTPYVHQAQAFTRLNSAEQQPRPTLITTGTGSGKTECFLYPLLDHCYRHRNERGIKGIILYPMNALASDQAIRLAKEINGHDQLRGNVRAGLYVGGSSATPHKQMGPDFVIDDRDSLKNDPPDILLTNFKMLDFLLIRPEDRPLWANNWPETLQYLILDELHTFDGAQGSDVALLIRRLKARLKTPTGHLCPVGTSATVAGGGGESASKLTEFASQIFGELFDSGSVITETRQPLSAFIPAETDERPLLVRELPPVLTKNDKEQLRAVPGEDPDQYLKRQMMLWFDEVHDPIQLGEALLTHSFLRTLLRATLDGAGNSRGVLLLDDLNQLISERDVHFATLPTEAQALLVQSFISLVAHARRQDGGRQEPFLTVQSQVWVREMSRLMRQVTADGESPAFFWRDDRSHDIPPLGLPAYVCRECGHSGWLSSMQKGDERLARETKVIYGNYFARSSNVRYVYPAESGLTYQEYLDPNTLDIHTARTGEGSSNFLPVVIHSRASQSSQPRDLQRCPICENDQSLTILGRQAASLLSVAIGYLFTSPINDDKKLLAFTDSVQDASHRAAFFGQRTYRFSLRTAIQSMLEAAPSGTIPLPRMTDALLRWLRPQLASQLDERLQGSIEQKLAATLIPPDLRDLNTYRRFLDEAPVAEMPPDLAEIIQKRVSWEITMEYGFNAHLGRSLEVVGSSAAALNSSVLDQTVQRLLPVLQEEMGSLSSLTSADLTHFLLGLLNRSRLRGGIAHPLLKRYIQSNGNWYLLTRKQNRLLSPFYKNSPRFPRFLADSGSKTFDTYTTMGSAQTWFVEWARKSLSADLSLNQINGLYRQTMGSLVDQEILQVRQEGGKRMFAIRPEALLITRHVAQLSCDRCGDSHTVAQDQLEQWRNTPCISYRCEGRLTVEKAADQSYYHTMYSNGQVERIFSAEHTGLLDRATREETERLFKTQPKMDAPNLLTATPTLEMGIDVGDLSATLACSVPPRPANYLQRIGRAGRKTGNAFILALANARDHDLYFFAEPSMMLKGEIIPPGCFLDAPEMLQRQFFAHALDCWTADAEEIKRMPQNVKLMLAAKKKGGFPADFLGWFEKNQKRTAVQFLDLLGDELSAESQEQILQFGTDQTLPNLIETAIGDAIEQKAEMRKDIRMLRDDQKKIEAAPSQYDNPDLDIGEIKLEVNVLHKAIRNLDEKYLLNFFTDASLLPNYAFPEPGIELKAIVSGFARSNPDQQDDGPGYELYEFERAAAVGIRELAPFNTFYAFGRKMEIGRIDVKHRQSTLEPWQFCPVCSTMGPVSKIHHSPTCPNCGSHQWADHGQLHKMLSLRAVESRVSDQNSRAGDEGDEREREIYETHTYFEVDSSRSAGGWLIPSLPFGFETFKQLTLREINFGLTEGFGSKRVVAGEEVQEVGFRVCPGCGEVEDMREKEGSAGRATHARTCPHYRRWLQSKKEIPWEKIYLYRELQTEGLRLLLPISDALTRDRLESFKAALQLGLRLVFGGTPDHLQIDFHTEVDHSGARRRFLMIYDTVPGGTSYLRDLGQPDKLKELFSLSQQHIGSCECILHENKKACHLCLYTPRTGRERDFINRTDALDTIGQILYGWGDLEQTSSLSQVDISNVIESELEMRFIHLLEKIAGERVGWGWQALISNGKEVFDLKTSGNLWRIEPQVDLGPQQGVEIACRPDFLLTPKNGAERKPIALFLDGYRYHVQPNQPESRLADDVRKRRSLIDSSDYLVWSISWEDLDRYEGKKAADPLKPLFPNSLQFLQANLSRRANIELSSALFIQDGVSQLLPLLENYNLADWKLLAHFSKIAAVAKGRPPLDKLSADRVVSQLLEQPELMILNFEGSGAGNLRYDAFDDGLLQVFCLVVGKDQVQTILRLNDSQAERQSDQFALAWQRFLHHLNIWQFANDFEPVTASLIREQVGESEHPATENPQPSQTVAAGWELLKDEVLPEVAPLLLHLTKLPLPTVGFELTDSKGHVVAQAELGWEDAKVALLLEDQQIDRPAFDTAGWHTVVFDEQNSLGTAEELVASFKSMGENG